jgi:hypothetical protein
VGCNTASTRPRPPGFPANTAKGTLAAKSGHWTSTAVTMVNGADTLAVPSALEGGKAFYDTWQASQ